MEYPTFITGGSLAHFPTGVRTLEGLIVHEFCHQYFMGMLASNEKEEPWLDEGFVTYVEGRIMDATYGPKKSLFDILGYQLGKREMSRVEYTGLKNPKIGSIARPGWEVVDDYKEIIYRKTATVLESLRGMVGDQAMEDIMKTYYDRFSFKHPRGSDFRALASEIVAKHHGDKFGENLDWFFKQTLDETGICDYAATGIFRMSSGSTTGFIGDGENKKFISENNDSTRYSVRVERLGELVFPLDVKFTTWDDEVIMREWDGEGKVYYFQFDSTQSIKSVHIDPEQKIYMDVDLNNNSLNLDPNKSALIKYGTKALYWVQNALQTIGMFI